jgi:hypothetical protein
MRGTLPGRDSSRRRVAFVFTHVGCGTTKEAEDRLDMFSAVLTGSGAAVTAEKPLIRPSATFSPSGRGEGRNGGARSLA